MKAFIITSIVLYTIGAVARLVCLALLDYPRVLTYSRGNDAGAVVILIAWCVWGLLILIR